MRQKIKMTKITAVILIAMLIAAMLPSFSFADSEIVISDPNQIVVLSYSKDASELSANYRLACDIDMSKRTDERPIKAIGDYSGSQNDIPFSGTFDGGGHKITNLTTTAEALFSYIGEGGSVKNLTLENASVHYSQNNSFKYPAVLVSLNKGEISDCMIINSSVVSDYCSPAGGLAGTNFGSIRRCGVAGGSVTFAVSKLGTSHGGFVGNQRGGMIEECFSNAVIDAKKWAGGFAGKIEDGVISDCYSGGVVNGTEEVGGFAGAFMRPAEMRNCYSISEVNAQSGGGLVGGKGFSFAVAAEPTNCYYMSDTRLPQNSDTFFNDPTWAKSTEEMRSAEFAAALSEKWAQDDNINDGYPYLISAAPPVTEDKKDVVTARLMIAVYDKNNYEFYKQTGPYEVTIAKDIVTVSDVLAAAGDQGLEYSFGTGSQSGQVVTIGGVTPKAPDGWMFAINGGISPVGAGAALVPDGVEILWYEGTAENGYAPPEWSDIENAADPIEYEYINTAEQLAELARIPEKQSGAYKLAADIDLKDSEFIPIGSKDMPFTGIFDGNGFKITNIKINQDTDSQNIGMFGVIRGATLKNITLENISVTGGSVVGGLVGRAEPDSESGKVSLIAGCRAEGTVTATGTSYIRRTDVGGLLGINAEAENKNREKTYKSAVSDCTADVLVTALCGGSDASEPGHVGGLVGMNEGVISNSKALGDVFGGNTTGGFVGSNYGGSIYASRAEGDVQGGYSVGGFAGSSGLYSLIENSYSGGNVTAITEYGSNYGGFAGAASGKLKNCISSGTLTPGWNYNGGFAGKYDGAVWSYSDELRGISGCFGNIVTSGGDLVKPIGNYIGGSHAPADAAVNEIGVDKQTAELKITEMLDAAATESKLKAEAAKYKRSAVIPEIVEENSDITALAARIEQNVSADADVNVSYSAEGDMITAKGGSIILTGKPEGGSETLTINLNYGGETEEIPVKVSIAPKRGVIDIKKVLANIEDRYLSSAIDYWEVAMLEVYEDMFGSSERFEAKKRDLAKVAVSGILSAEQDTTAAMNIITLRGLGYDPTRITTESGEKINALNALKKLEPSGNNGDAYRLLAYLNCGVDPVDEPDAEAAVSRLLENMIDGKGWSNNKDDGIDCDTTGAAIMGLSAYSVSDPRVKTAVDGAIKYLSSQMQPDGNIKSGYEESNYGTNANTSAMCALGLSALGIKIGSDPRFTKNGATLLDGIVGFTDANRRGFVYQYGDTETDDMATKQAALAVMAIEKCDNVLDFSHKSSTPFDLTQSAQPSTEPTTEPTFKPTETPEPSDKPTIKPTEIPKPTTEPTVKPTEIPEPTTEPTVKPTEIPEPSTEPTIKPTEMPEPSTEPTIKPTGIPEPSTEPTIKPTEIPEPSTEPTIKPTEMPEPSAEPSIEPSAEPELYEYEIENYMFDESGKLSVDVKQNSDKHSKAVLIAAAYAPNGVMTVVETLEISGGGKYTIDFKRSEGGEVKIFVWDIGSLAPLAESK